VTDAANIADVSPERKKKADFEYGLVPTDCQENLTSTFLDKFIPRPYHRHIWVANPRT